MAKFPRCTGPDGRYVELDERHSIAREHCGAAKPRWVHRFCGEFIAAHDTKADATRLALQWEHQRVARIERVAGVA